MPAGGGTHTGSLGNASPAFCHRRGPSCDFFFQQENKIACAIYSLPTFLQVANKIPSLGLADFVGMPCFWERDPDVG